LVFLQKSPPGKFHARNLLPVPLWDKKPAYASREEEVKHRNEATGRYVVGMRQKLLELIDKEMEEDRVQLEYTLRNYAEMFFKQRSPAEWKKAEGEKSV
jgi:hypothetical protein